MLTRNSFKIFNTTRPLAATWQDEAIALRKENYEFKKSIQKYFGDLNNKGALALNQINLWTPVLTFATPGDQNIVLSTAFGDYSLIERTVIASFRIVTSTFTHTTSAGDIQITGLPFAASSTTNYLARGTCAWEGITKANYTQVNSNMNGAGSTINFTIAGSGQAITTVQAGDMPSAGTVRLSGVIVYHTT
jgi:hypothetical protein